MRPAEEAYLRASLLIWCFKDIDHDRVESLREARERGLSRLTRWVEVSWICVLVSHGRVGSEDRSACLVV